ncbi:MAG TPA: PqqD family protein [Actinomycetota bacterium]|nr:PqqD family protein [Actinomycetota bacterium]
MERIEERPQTRADLTVVELDGEAVIYDEMNGDLHRLNPTATLVFSLLDGSSTVEDLALDIAKAYGMPVDEITAQVRELADRFAASHLLIETEPDMLAEVDGDDGA